MHIEKKYISNPAEFLLKNNVLAEIAFNEIEDSIISMKSVDQEIFIINNSTKNGNGVVPIKEKCYQILEEKYVWYREKPLDYLSEKMGGPIDVYKMFGSNPYFNVGVEFETGNISSAHRSMNKLLLGLHNKELHLAILLMPIRSLSYYLTDRVSNYEEIEPYMPLVSDVPFILIGFDAEGFSPDVPFLAKGNDGMSTRAKHKWKDNFL